LAAYFDWAQISGELEKGRVPDHFYMALLLRSERHIPSVVTKYLITLMRNGKFRARPGRPWPAKKFSGWETVRVDVDNNVIPNMSLVALGLVERRAPRFLRDFLADEFENRRVKGGRRDTREANMFWKEGLIGLTRAIFDGHMDDIREERGGRAPDYVKAARRRPAEEAYVRTKKTLKDEEKVRYSADSIRNIIKRRGAWRD
jgi:hypothetical protein